MDNLIKIGQRSEWANTSTNEMLDYISQKLLRGVKISMSDIRVEPDTRFEGRASYSISIIIEDEERLADIVARNCNLASGEELNLYQLIFWVNGEPTKWLETITKPESLKHSSALGNSSCERLDGVEGAKLATFFEALGAENLANEFYRPEEA